LLTKLVSDQQDCLVLRVRKRRISDIHAGFYATPQADHLTFSISCCVRTMNAARPLMIKKNFLSKKTPKKHSKYAEGRPGGWQRSDD
jgi:hypothetical protein